MFFASWTSFLLSAAIAADRADVPPGALTLAGEGFEIHVLGRGVPLIENIAPPKSEGGQWTGGMCRVRFYAKDGVLASQVKECPEVLRDEIVPASKYWLFETTGDLTGVAFDVWYLVDGRGVTTHLAPTSYAVSGNELPAWTLVPKAITLPAWPPGQSLAARCHVTVTTDRLTGAVTDATVAEDNCPSGYGPDVLAAVKTWTIEPVSTLGTAIPLVFEATVRFDPPADGAPAVIDVELPVPGSTEVPVVGEAPRDRKLPREEPLFRLHHKTYADVLVFGVGVPAFPAATEARSCSFLLQVNSAGRTWIWPEQCPAELTVALENSRQSWSLVAARPRENQLYARFRGTWDIPADGSAPRLLVPEGDLVGTKVKLPAGVESFVVASPLHRVPPKVKAGTTFPHPEVCQLDVTVGRSGKVSEVVPAAVAGAAEPGGCPADLLVLAQKSVGKWRWAPAEANGEAFASHASVKVKFGGGGE